MFKKFEPSNEPLVGAVAWMLQKKGTNTHNTWPKCPVGAWHQFHHVLRHSLLGVPGFRHPGDSHHSVHLTTHAQRGHRVAGCGDRFLRAAVVNPILAGTRARTAVARTAGTAAWYHSSFSNPLKNHQPVASTSPKKSISPVNTRPGKSPWDTSRWAASPRSWHRPPDLGASGVPRSPPRGSSRPLHRFAEVTQVVLAQVVAQAPALRLLAQVVQLWVFGGHP